MHNLERELEEKIVNAQSEEELLAILTEAGINITLDELRSAESENGELDEVALENVSGGGAFWAAVRRAIRTISGPIGRPFRGGGGNAGGR